MLPPRFASFLVAPLAIGTVSATSDAPIVNTTYGLVQGTTSDLRDDVSVFRGIPYAAPPTGSSRWKAPAAPASWSGVKNTTTFSAICEQGVIGENLFSSGSSDVSEDCLYMNIWAPKNASSTSNLPVYVWIYGGRFQVGDGAALAYEGSHLAAKDMIVVTFNYRVGILGFFAHPELSAESGHNSSGNYGLLDMVALLTYVTNEISAFGGNPSQITVGGQSAGSASSLDMMYSPLSKSMVAGVISESGARSPYDPMIYQLATSYRTKAEAESYGTSFMSSINITTLEEMRNLSAATLLTYNNADSTILDGTAFQNVSAFAAPPEWRPNLDGYVLPAKYGEILASGAHGDVPILTGNTKDESGASTDPGLNLTTYTTQYTEMFGNLSAQFFELYPAENDTSANDASNAMFQDLSRVTTWLYGNDWHAGGADSNVYTYYWTHAPPSQTAGAYHGSEMPYAFGTIGYALPNTSWTADDYSISDTMSEYWANFIKTGNPNGGNLTVWSPSGSDNTTMWLGDSWGAGSIADNEHIAFIKLFLDNQPVEW